MASQRDTTARQARLQALIERVQGEETRALVRRGIALWIRAEIEWSLNRRPPTTADTVN